MKLFLRIANEIDKTIQGLFNVLTKEQENAVVTRFAITFLDLWQAIIIVNHNYWIPELVNITLSIQIYTIYACILATLAVFSLVLARRLWLSAVVLGINGLMYMLLGISSLWYIDPPRASAGFSFFVMFISITAFWRIILHIQRDRDFRKRI